MRPSALLLLVVLLIAAACTGQAQPTPTATSAPTDEPAAALTPPQPFSELATSAAENAILITPPVAGTLSVADSRQTPDFTRAPLDFALVRFIREQGIDGELLIITVESSGVLTVNGESREIADLDLERVRMAFEMLQIYEIQGVFTIPGAPADAARYNLAISGSRGAVSIDAIEGYVPSELQTVFDLMLDIAQPLPNAEPAS